MSRTAWQTSSGRSAYQKIWRAENRDRIAAWRIANHEKIKEQKRKSYRKLRDHSSGKLDAIKERRRQYMQSIDAKLRSYQHNASKRGYGFTLTREEFISLWQKPCHYCGIEIKSVGLDRVDNAIGYVFSNVVSCCSPCNYAKGDLTAEQFFAMCKRIVERHCD